MATPSWPVDSKRDGLSLSGSQASFPLTTAKREWKRGSMCKREKGLSGKEILFFVIITLHHFQLFNGHASKFIKVLNSKGVLSIFPLKGVFPLKDVFPLKCIFPLKGVFPLKVFSRLSSSLPLTHSRLVPACYPEARHVAAIFWGWMDKRHVAICES